MESPKLDVRLRCYEIPRVSTDQCMTIRLIDSKWIEFAYNDWLGNVTPNIINQDELPDSVVGEAHIHDPRRVSDKLNRPSSALRFYTSTPPLSFAVQSPAALGTTSWDSSG